MRKVSLFDIVITMMLVGIAAWASSSHSARLFTKPLALGLATCTLEPDTRCLQATGDCKRAKPQEPRLVTTVCTIRPGGRGDTNDTKSSARDIPPIPMRFRLAGVTG
jgi:hypothetical protein